MDIEKFIEENILHPDNVSKIPYIYRERYRKGELKIAGMITVVEKLGKATKTIVVKKKKSNGNNYKYGG